MRRVISMRVSRSLYDKLEEVRQNFKRVNGIDMSTIQAGEFFAKNTKMPIIPNILKNGKQIKKKSRPY